MAAIEDIREAVRRRENEALNRIDCSFSEWEAGIDRARRAVAFWGQPQMAWVEGVD